MQLFDVAGRSGPMRGLSYFDMPAITIVFESGLGMQAEGLGSGNTSSFGSPSQFSLPSTRDRTESYQIMMRADFAKLREMVNGLTTRTSSRASRPEWTSDTRVLLLKDLQQAIMQDSLLKMCSAQRNVGERPEFLQKQQEEITTDANALRFH